MNLFKLTLALSQCLSMIVGLSFSFIMATTVRAQGLAPSGDENHQLLGALNYGHIQQDVQVISASKGYSRALLERVTSQSAQYWTSSEAARCQKEGQPAWVGQSRTRDRVNQEFEVFRYTGQTGLLLLENSKRLPSGTVAIFQSQSGGTSGITLLIRNKDSDRSAEEPADKYAKNKHSRIERVAPDTDSPWAKENFCETFKSAGKLTSDLQLDLAFGKVGKVHLPTGQTSALMPMYEKESQRWSYQLIGMPDTIKQVYETLKQQFQNDLKVRPWSQYKFEEILNMGRPRSQRFEAVTFLGMNKQHYVIALQTEAETSTVKVMFDAPYPLY